METQNIVDRVKRPIALFPQRYEPLNALKRNQYIGLKWTDEMVRGLVKMYTHLHGFITLNTGPNPYKMDRISENDFYNNIKEANKNQKPTKFTGDVIYLLEY